MVHVMKRALSLALATALAILPAPAAVAQQSNFAITPTADSQAAPGWTVTPAIGVGSSWDDNVLVRNSLNETPGDILSVVNPQATASYNGGRGQLAANYSGAFILYRDFNTLDSYDQRGTLFARRLVTKHVALFVRNSFA